MAVLPNLCSIVPYNTVVHETTIMEQYNLVQQYQSGPSDEEYARLNTNEYLLPSIQLNQIYYTDMTPSYNSPVAPPTLHSIVPYSTVVHETSIIGHCQVMIYDLSCHH